METRTIEVKNKKLFQMLTEKGKIVDKGRAINKKIEPLQAKIKPLIEEIKELEKQIAVIENKMQPLTVKDFESFKKQLGEFEDVVSLNTKDNDIVEYKVVNIVERAKENFKEAKKQREAKK